MTEEIREDVSAAVDTWGLELIPEAERPAAQVAAAEGRESGDIHRLTQAIVLELGVAVGSGVIALIAGSHDRPAWVPARIVWSAAAEALASKMKEREAVLIEAAAKQYGFTPQQVREVAADVAKKLAAQRQRFIAAVASLVVAQAFEAGSLARLKGLLEERARPASASHPPASDTTPGVSPKPALPPRWGHAEMPMTVRMSAAVWRPDSAYD